MWSGNWPTKSTGCSSACARRPSVLRQGSACGVPIERYPRALAALDLDLALAPVEQNLFNECKSNLRLLEYGACGFPVVCSDALLPGRSAGDAGEEPFPRLDAIRMRDLDAAARAGITCANGCWRIDARRRAFARLVSCLDAGLSGRRGFPSRCPQRLGGLARTPPTGTMHENEDGQNLKLPREAPIKITNANFRGAWAMPTRGRKLRQTYRPWRASRWP